VQTTEPNDTLKMCKHHLNTFAIEVSSVRAGGKAPAIADEVRRSRLLRPNPGRYRLKFLRRIIQNDLDWNTVKVVQRKLPVAFSGGRRAKFEPVPR